MSPSPDPSLPRAALQFALDVTGGRDVVYRVAVYLQELIRQMQDAPGFSRRARIDILLFDGQTAQSVPPERLLESASALAQGQAGGARFLPLYQQIRALPYEGGAFHTFLLLTRNPAEGWSNEVTPLLRLVASVTSLCCGPDCAPDVAIALSKDPGGTRVVNPLDQISRQFDSIALWLTQHFAERPPPPMPTLPEEAPVHAPPPAPVHAPPPAPVTRPLQPAQWRVQEPQDPSDPVPHVAVARVAGAGGWHALAASRRGKLHAHEGSYREDAFALGTHEDWVLLAVADGAGSCRLSRVGARLASEAAIAGMTKGLRRAWPPDAAEVPETALRRMISDGIAEAHAAVYTEAGRRGIAVRDLSSTLLMLAFGPVRGGQRYLAVGQIGDGLLLTVGKDGTLTVLGAADKGYYAGETVFLPSLPANEWDQHTWATSVDSPLEMVMVMSDGVADDLVPLQRQAGILIDGVRGVLPGREPERAVLDLLTYEKRDSADDRTLAVLYQEGK